MLTRRIIPCLDIRHGRVVKGVRFQGLRDMGDPLALAARYAQCGADELCLLDVSASLEQSPLTLDLIRRLSREVFIPLTVGGGVSSVEDARALLRAGADKVALNSAALHDPDVLARLADEFGSQCVVLSVDTRVKNGRWLVTSHSATRELNRDCLEWVQEGTQRGAGEVLLNVIDTDGGRNGFQLGITRRVAQEVQVPVIASGGAGSVQHFIDVFTRTGVSAALAASIFHRGDMTPASLKESLRQHSIEVRP